MPERITDEDLLKAVQKYTKPLRGPLTGIRITHLRSATLNGQTILAEKHVLKLLGLKPETNGGVTIATTASGQVGVAICRPDEGFNKKIGRDTAIGRATKGDAELLGQFVSHTD